MLNMQSLSLAARSGFLKALTGPSQFSDRFQLGGPLSLRSFRANSMGPRDGGISQSSREESLS
jgi:outer membrane protein insertion porin family